MYRDYHTKGVNFFYVYKKLTHPENNGYVDPILIEERLRHVAIAKKAMHTEFTWICDNMENELSKAMGGAPNSEFLIDGKGEIIISRQWSDPAQLRQDLAGLVGESEKVTQVSDLGYRVNPKSKRGDKVAKGVLPRIELPENSSALKSKLTSNSEGENYYVKLHAEADSKLLNEDAGKLYLALHIDPIYAFHWNNLAGEAEIELKLANGEVVMKKLKNPDVDADVDPREIIIEIEEEAAKGPIEVTGKFFVCDDGGTICLNLTQTYQVELAVDREAGRRSAGGARRGRGGAQGRGGNGDRAKRMMQRDTNGDGKISKDEMPERAKQMFDRMDANSDGFIDQEEMKNMPRGRGSRGGRAN